MKILVPTSTTLDLAADPDLEVVGYDPSEPFDDGQLDAEVLIAWNNSADNLADAAARLHKLRLVQTLAAGPDAVVAAGFGDDVAIASGRSLHDGPVAEHTLALILAAVRRFDELFEAQQQHTWLSDYARAQAAPGTHQHFTLDGATVVVWGFGSIAGRLAPLLRMLGADVTGVAHTAGIRYGFDVVAADALGDLLGRTDVLVSLLPGSPETRDTYDAAFFAALKPGAVFVNAGRGATVDETALIAALTDGRLRVAALDVTKTEPLPADSPLWETPGVILTPHIAGGRPQGASRLVLENVRALRTGGELTNRVT
ncbi:NAD(P)-dependent oxidoreductase [Subtercola endophyticus]|uniref:NAD(P)-dependent oxidoreductase n=1 Tax=Subtercola endophyticus TaxID=2895559 RepID=UPI001E50AC6A|nr:NAD(P)-dependent oxidoreductase [Subtercola endophyticus]UFS58690.1 phosphoglycerate dehydrogenase [Subtercola endophyticus]